MPPAPDFRTLDLTEFSVGGMLRAGIAVRQAVAGAPSLEEAATCIVRYFYEKCVEAATGERSCALVRFYKTHPYSALEPDLQRIASAQLGTVTPAPWLRCLTLMASAGDEPAWNSRHESRSHRAIPLPSAERVRAAPMIMRLIEDLGIDVDTIVSSAEPSTRGAVTRTYDVFHVEQALGSPFIPAQRDFVIPYRIASVIGFGGLLRSGELFAVVMFSRTRIPVTSAARFRSIALDIRSSLFGFDESTPWKK